MANPRAPSFRGLPVPARIYIGAVLALALAAVAAAVAVADDPTLDLALFAIAAVLCATGNLFEVFAPANFSFPPNLIVFLCGALLLPPWAVAVLAVLSFLPGWLAHRFRWYMVAFNIANYAIAGLAAHMIVRTAGNFGGHWSPDFASAVALAAAAVAFVTINHALSVAVVTLARGRSLRHSAEDMLGVMPMDLALAMTGACLAALWLTTPALALLAFGPIVLIYRALWVPLLQHKSRTDPKTGLYNSEYLEKELEDSLASAKSGNRGLSVVMIDLDQLRLINNRHGHLAGDRLIRVLADAVSESATAHNGLAARFGGDELCVLLPDTGLDQAREIAEKMRARIEDIDVPFDDVGQRLSITASAGLAAYPEHADTAEGLLRVADAAVYDAKLGGRNRTRTALPPAARDALAIGSEPEPTPILEHF